MANDTREPELTREYLRPLHSLAHLSHEYMLSPLSCGGGSGGGTPQGPTHASPPTGTSTTPTRPPPLPSAAGGLLVEFFFGVSIKFLCFLHNQFIVKMLNNKFIVILGKFVTTMYENHKLMRKQLEFRVCLVSVCLGNIYLDEQHYWHKFIASSPCPPVN